MAATGTFRPAGMERSDIRSTWTFGTSRAGKTWPAPLLPRAVGSAEIVASVSLTDETLASAPAGDPVEEVRAYCRDRGVQFLFAQFVDMHGKPNAKLVPVHRLDDLLADGAGFAGFAAGEVGQKPSDPDLIAMPDARSFT